MHTTKWKGVNLGGWLVLEKWMTPSLFAGHAAIDEYGLCRELGTRAKIVLANHRDTFITEADFAWLCAHGVNAVRLPVGYWIFDGSGPYVGGIEYVDKVMKWAQKHTIAVVLDLHGAPGSQNGKDHSGKVGPVQWKDEQNIIESLKTLEQLAERYASTPALAAIELLNEPSWHLGKKRLNRFYEAAYDRIRNHCDMRVAIIFPDAYKPKKWRWTMRGQQYENVLLDVHLYQLFGWGDLLLSGKWHIRKALHRTRLIRKLQTVRPVIIGEWSAALPPRAYRGHEPKALQQTYADAQMLAMQEAMGWFYWSYKTEHGGPWSFRDCVERGILKIV
jgi:glucan 1,3-beta-glucosidase